MGVADAEVGCQHLLELLVVAGCFWPQGKLFVVEFNSFLRRHACLPKIVETAAVDNLNGAQAILVGIVGVDLSRGEVGIAVAFPSAAKIELVIYATYLILAAES